MTLVHRSAALVALLTALGIAVACGSDSGSTGPTGDCILPTTSNFVDSAQGRVVIVGTSYNPATIQVRKGMTVKWVYCERANSDPHTVTSDAGLWDSGLLSSGSFSRAFAIAGSFAYHCIPHPEMTAVVTVVD
jgi:plastocyanin